MNRWWIAGAGALGLALAAHSVHRGRHQGRAVESAGGRTADRLPGTCRVPAKAAPLDHTVKDMNGNDVRLADYKGKVNLLQLISAGISAWQGPTRWPKLRKITLPL